MVAESCLPILGSYTDVTITGYVHLSYHLHHNTDLIITGYVHLVYPYGNSDHCWLCPPILWSPSQY